MNFSFFLHREDKILESYYDHQVPPALPQFAAEFSGLDYNREQKELYLYHGTNCYRRFEITRSGFIEPGRNHYSFFCTNPGEAYTYARAAAMRDMDPNSMNSLICEPVVLKVKFTERTWVQVDFVKPTNPNEVKESDSEMDCLSMAVLGPISSDNIIEVLHCTHGRRMEYGSFGIKTFADGTVLEGIQQLKETLAKKRLDAWMMKKIGLMKQTVSTKLSGGEVPELTSDDHLRKLRKNQLRA